MSGLREFIRDYGKQIEREDETAWYLWQKLPSYVEAKRFHSDYADEFQPCLQNILEEARLFIDHKLNPTPEQIEEAGEFYKCPCGEDHDEEIKEN